MSSAAAGDARYGRVAMALHWLIGLALAAQWTFGLLLDDLAPRGTPARGAWVNLHKSFGIVLGLLIVARLLWRLGHPPPPWPQRFSVQQQRWATLGHGLLYLLMLLLPTFGYLASNFSKHGVRFFGWPWPAWGPDLPDVYKLLNNLHGLTAWLLAAVVAGHVALALWHGFVRRDGLLARMLPNR